MNTHSRLGPTVLASFLVAVTLYSCTSIGPTAPPTPSQTPTPASTPTPAPTAAPSPTALPSATLGPSGPALTETFTSAIHGISISYPAGWSVQPASAPWLGGPFFFRDPAGDFLYDTALTDHLFLALASEPLAGQSPDTWAADLLALEGCSESEPVVVDGAEGVIGTDCGVTLVSMDGRGYFIWLYVSGDDPEVGEVYNRTWLDQVLATVELNPQDALAGYAAEFSLPFRYVLPAEPEFDYGTTNRTWFEVRVPEYNDAGHPGGVILQAIGGGREDPCDSASPEEAIEAGPQAVIDYLKTIPQIDVTDEVPATVGDLEAVQATVVVRTPNACPDSWPWSEDTESMPSGLKLRVVAVDVGDEHLVFTVFGEDTNPGFIDLTETYIDSIRFE